MAFRIIVFYAGIKVGVTKQIDSAYFRIILTQDWTVNSFEGVQRKQAFIWSIGIEKLEALEALETQLYFTCSAIAKKTSESWKLFLNLNSTKMAYSGARSCKKLYFTLLQKIITKIFAG